MRMKNVARLLALTCFLVTPLLIHAQSNELAFTLGGNFVTNNDFGVDTTFGAEASYAHTLFHLPRVSLMGELPVAFGAKNILRPGGGIGSATGFSSIFVTPGVKLRIDALRFSPYFVVGGGVAHFNGQNGSLNTTTGAVDFGGGVDWRVLPHIGLRGEVRDYNSGVVSFLGRQPSGRQQNVLITGGIVFRF